MKVTYPRVALALILAAAAWSPFALRSCRRPAPPPPPRERPHSLDVRVALADGQVLHGTVSTEAFVVKTSLGELSFPAAHTGELGPLEGDDMKTSGNAVRLWVRDGSEFIGEWVAPGLEVVVHVGGQDVPVSVPIDRLERCQFRAAAVRPQGAVHRVRTTHGDDFLVDPARSRIAFRSDLGRFETTLAEVRDMEPISEDRARWRFHLTSGTVLTGEIEGKALTLALVLGPDSVTIPIDRMASIARETWQMRAQAQQLAYARDGRHGGRYDETASQGMRGEEMPGEPQAPRAAVAARLEQARSSADADDAAAGEGFFSKDVFVPAKRTSQP